MRTRNAGTLDTDTATRGRPEVSSIGDRVLHLEVGAQNRVSDWVHQASSRRAFRGGRPGEEEGSTTVEYAIGAVATAVILMRV